MFFALFYFFRYSFINSVVVICCCTTTICKKWLNVRQLLLRFIINCHFTESSGNPTEGDISNGYKLSNKRYTEPSSDLKRCTSDELKNECLNEINNLESKKEAEILKRKSSGEQCTSELGNTCKTPNGTLPGM